MKNCLKNLKTSKVLIFKNIMPLAEGKDSSFGISRAVHYMVLELRKKL